MPKEGLRFKYQSRSVDDVKGRANNRGGGFDSFIKPQFKLYKVKEGKNLIRILPPTWPKANHYGYDIWVNYQIGADNQSYLSLSKMGKGRDPIAEARNEASREGDEKLVRDLSPRQRILWWIIDRHAEDEGPQVWPCPLTVDKDVANLCFDPDTREVMYIDDPENGNDLSFDKEGQGLKTRYEASKMRLKKPSPLHEDPEVAEAWLQFITENPLPETLNFYSYDHIAEVFNGQSRPSSDEDDAPQPKRPALAAKRPVAPPEPEEDEQPDEDGVLPDKPTVREEAVSANKPALSIRDRLRQRRSVQAKSVEDE